MTDSRTVRVIGGGHNGLVCATYLARAGYAVEVLEANDAVGGGAASYSFAAGYKAPGLAHVLYGLNSKVCKDLDLAGAGLDVGPAVATIALNLKGKHLTLKPDSVTGEGLPEADIAAYASFKREFRAYAAALEPLMMNKPPRLKDMDRQDKFTLARLGWKLRFGLGADSMSEFLRVGGINVYDVLNEVFSDARLQGAIAVDAVLGHHMGPRTPGTVLTYLHRLQGENFAQQSLPPGGMEGVTKALLNAARKAGVSIRTGAKVVRIVVDDGKARAVQLQSGEELAADIVVSNADAKTTFLDLVGTLELDAMFAHRVHKTRSRGDVARLYLALNGLPNIPGLSAELLGQRLLVAPDMRYLEHAFNHAKYGEYSQHPLLEITLPSIADPSLAPTGGHLMSVSASFAPYALKAGWEHSREQFSERVVALIAAYAPGFEAQVLASELLTPVDIEQKYHLSGGHWHHGELTIDQSFMMRPVHGTAQYDTPVDGLFLCGAAAHPGGGITGVPGHNAAQRIVALGGAG